MKKHLILLCLISILVSPRLIGQPDINIKKQYTTQRIENPPIIDGNLNDDSYSDENWSGNFIQFKPSEGEKPSQKTEFNIIYDNNFLYVGIKAYDSAPDSIVNRMTRRDDIDGDYVGVIFDSYHDLRTGFSFFVSSAGVKLDQLYINDGHSIDPTWDPIWYVSTQYYDWGWAAEMKIPLTQLRFEKELSKTWGLEVSRQLYRNNEISYWQHIPRNSSGLVHMFGELNGLNDIQSMKTLDINPYTVFSYHKYEPETNNPFASGSNFFQNIGLDAKIGITNNLTLDLSINPDFGQVEADPSEVNLTAFETFFQEKRPFFLEGKNITTFTTGIGDGSIGNDGLFYSRRIGRKPQGSPKLEDGEFADVPRNVKILGAAKITGKTKNGWSLGIIESVTQKTMAKIDSFGENTLQEVEPLTNYLILRAQKDLNEGNTLIGSMITNTYRDLKSIDNLEDSFLNSLHNSATTGGIDFTQYFREKNWMLKATIAGSFVEGSQEAITRTQTSSIHLFQRPETGYIEFDSLKTSISGQGGNFQFGKVGGGNWKFVFSSLWNSPGFETNDLGYLMSADDITNILWSRYDINKPFSVFRRIRFNTNHLTMHDFGGNFLGLSGDFSVYSQFKNFWDNTIGINWNVNQISNTLLRGGPAIKLPGDFSVYLSISSDPRKKLGFTLQGAHTQGKEDYSKVTNTNLNVTYRPFNNLQISLSPSFIKSRLGMQYLAYRNSNSEPRYLFGDLNQTTFRMPLRINYYITPNLSIQYWGQPFFAAGDFTKIKMISDNPKATKYTDRFHIYSDQQISLVNGIYMVDEDLNGSVDYNINNPNFNFNEFLSNFILRWEYKPGSTIFIVWSQNRNTSSSIGEFALCENANDLFILENGYNIFLIKVSHRFGLNK